jgi:hypothetical protein
VSRIFTSKFAFLVLGAQALANIAANRLYTDRCAIVLLDPRVHLKGDATAIPCSQAQPERPATLGRPVLGSNQAARDMRLVRSH